MVDSSDILFCCELCPRRCKANRAAGQRGVCGAGSQVRVARAALHFWEEPPVSGTEGSGAVFFSHCPLHCVYCQNANIANGAHGANISVERLAQIFLELQGQGARTINLVTATHYVPQAAAALDAARAAGLTLPVVYNTSGYELPETLALIAPQVSTWLADFRYSNPETARAYSHAPDYPEVAKRAFAFMAKAVEEGANCPDALLIARILLLPGHVDETKEIVRYLHETYGHLEAAGRMRLSMMSQYTPLRAFPDHPELERRVTPDEFEELLDFADSIGCDDYFWQEGEAAQESFIPDFNTLEGVEGPELELDRR